jgi:hypothetical protein
MEQRGGCGGQTDEDETGVNRIPHSKQSGENGDEEEAEDRREDGTPIGKAGREGGVCLGLRLTLLPVELA